MTQVAVERSIWIAAPREKVWHAITDPKLIQQWFSPTTPWELSALEVGGKLYAVGYESQTCVIEVVDAPRLFRYRWDAQPPDKPLTLVTTFALEAEKGGTRLTFTETGFASLPNDDGSKRARQNNAGWKMALRNLQAYLEGKDLPYPNGL
jgi:uncharacterized protein YndB with AHSA1/START domain